MEQSTREESDPVTQPALAPPRTTFAILLNVAGIVVVGLYLAIEAVAGQIAFWAVVVTAVSLLAWAASLIVPRKPVWALAIVYFVMIASGATAAWPSNGLAIAVVIAALLRLAASDAPPSVAYLAGGVAAALVAATPLALAASAGVRPSFESIVSLELAVLIALLGGANRRASRGREAAALEFAEQSANMREEQARASALAARQTLARDMHDVLAHSLGGLVIQLDAAEAQLEVGQADAALTRLRDARSMAASGLAEARRAVEALRSDPDAAPPVAGDDAAAALIELVDAHERLGGRIDFAQRGAPGQVSDEAATALRRALQESLSNARKHAPGEPVTVRLTWFEDQLELEVATPVPLSAAVDALATSGSGRGLAGMRERFAALPGGSVQTGTIGGEFVVRASAGLDTGASS
jgi:signal transduction histidine kinase